MEGTNLPQHFLSKICDLYQQSCLCDVTLTVTPGEEDTKLSSLQVHSVVLAAHSLLFRVLFSKSAGKNKWFISVRSENLKHWRTLVNFMYSGNLDINNENIDALSQLSQSYGIDTALALCKLYRSKHRDITHINSVTSDLQGHVRLQEVIYQKDKPTQAVQVTFIKQEFTEENAAEQSCDYDVESFYLSAHQTDTDGSQQISMIPAPVLPVIRNTYSKNSTSQQLHHVHSTDFCGSTRQKTVTSDYSVSVEQQQIESASADSEQNLMAVYYSTNVEQEPVRKTSPSACSDTQQSIVMSSGTTALSSDTQNLCSYTEAVVSDKTALSSDTHDSGTEAVVSGTTALSSGTEMIDSNVDRIAPVTNLITSETIETEALNSSAEVPSSVRLESNDIPLLMEVEEQDTPEYGGRSAAVLDSPSISLPSTCSSRVEVRPANEMLPVVSCLTGPVTSGTETRTSSAAPITTETGISSSASVTTETGISSSASVTTVTGLSSFVPCTTEAASQTVEVKTLSSTKATQHSTTGVKGVMKKLRQGYRECKESACSISGKDLDVLLHEHKEHGFPIDKTKYPIRTCSHKESGCQFETIYAATMKIHMDNHEADAKRNEQSLGASSDTDPLVLKAVRDSEQEQQNQNPVFIDRGHTEPSSEENVQPSTDGASLTRSNRGEEQGNTSTENNENARSEEMRRSETEKSGDIDGNTQTSENTHRSVMSSESQGDSRGIADSVMQKGKERNNGQGKKKSGINLANPKESTVSDPSRITPTAALKKDRDGRVKKLQPAVGVRIPSDDPVVTIKRGICAQRASKCRTIKTLFRFGYKLWHEQIHECIEFLAVVKEIRPCTTTRRCPKYKYSGAGDILTFFETGKPLIDEQCTTKIYSKFYNERDCNYVYMARPDTNNPDGAEDGRSHPQSVHVPAPEPWKREKFPQVERLNSKVTSSSFSQRRSVTAKCSEQIEVHKNQDMHKICENIADFQHGKERKSDVQMVTKDRESISQNISNGRGVVLPGTKKETDDPEERRLLTRNALRAAKSRALRSLGKLAYKLRYEQTYEPVEVLVIVKELNRNCYKYCGGGELVTLFQEGKPLIEEKFIPRTTAVKFYSESKCKYIGNANTNRDISVLCQSKVAEETAQFRTSLQLKTLTSTPQSRKRSLPTREQSPGSRGKKTRIGSTVAKQRLQSEGETKIRSVGMSLNASPAKSQEK